MNAFTREGKLKQYEASLAILYITCI